jgi:hypothetical protein
MMLRFAKDPSHLKLLAAYFSCFSPALSISSLLHSSPQLLLVRDRQTGVLAGCRQLELEHQ